MAAAQTKENQKVIRIKTCKLLSKSMKVQLHSLLSAMVLLGLAFAPGLQAQTIQDPSFETPVVGPINSYYSFQQDPSAAGWTFSGHAGIAATGSGYAYQRPGTPDGNQFAFLQGASGVGGSMSQTVNFLAGTYSFTFIASQRDVVGSFANNQSQMQTVTVSVDGGSVGSFTPGNDTSWYTFETTPISLAAGDHVLTFSNLAVPGDATVLLDMVNVITVPEPCTLALAGLGGLGFLVVRRRK
jgi:hypothetical protein